MNWFERYGIVGIFFVTMTSIWLLCLFPESRNLLSKHIIGFFSLSFLPIGYLIMIFSQAYYYLINSKNRTHCIHWKNLPDDKKREIRKEEEKFGNLPEEKELEMEAILTYYDRMRISDLERNIFLSKYITKRYDVIAINHGLMWATILSFMFAFAIWIAGMLPNITFSWNRFSVWFVIVLALLILIALLISKCLLEKQILMVGKRILREIKVAKK